MKAGLLSLLSLLLLWPAWAAAHPLAPALLQIEATSAQDFALQWRRSLEQQAGATLWPQLPAGCVLREPAQSRLDARGLLDSRARLHCSFRDWSGQRLGLSGDAALAVDVLIRIQQADGRHIETLLPAGEAQLRLPAAQARPSVGWRYLQLGLLHLLGGWDHLLFIAGLVLLQRRARRLLLSATAFTLGHSLTLSLAALQLLRLPATLAELGIAASLLLLALALLDAPQPRSLWQRHPAWLCLGFGLLHGLGFAAALREVGLPQDALLPALLAFNLGIECAQLLLMALLLGLLALLAPWRATAARWRRLPPYLIGSLAAYALLTRLLASF